MPRTWCRASARTSSRSPPTIPAPRSWCSAPSSGRRTRQGRDVVVVVRGPDEPMTVRRRDRMVGVWVNRDAAHFEGLPAYYYLASTQPVSRIASHDTLARYEIGLQQLKPAAVGSHHDPEPFRQAVIRHLQQSGLYTESPGSIDFLQRNPVLDPGAGAGGRGARPVQCRGLSVPRRPVGERPVHAAVRGRRAGWSGGCSTGAQCAASSTAWPAC